MLRQSGALILSLASVLAVADDQAIRQAVKPYLGNAQEIAITATPIPGVKAARDGLQLVYVSEDGAFILGGPLIDTETSTNLTEQVLNQARTEIMDAQSGELGLFSFPAPEPGNEVIVFTDIDCGYCRRLHAELDRYHDAGISLRYAMLPRAGKGSGSYEKTVHAACSDDPQQSITDAMSGAIPPPQTCDDHPIDRHMALARAMRVNMTPMMLLPDGRLLRGVHQPADLQALLSE